MPCYDLCSFRVHLDGEQIVHIAGNPDHAVTKGFVCSRAKGLLERHYSPDRIVSPMRRQGSQWQRIPWDAALDEISRRFTGAIEQHGPASLLHIDGAGSVGVLKGLGRRFFNTLGGVTRLGGLAARDVGRAAMQADFGAAASPAWSDLTRAKTIFLWGRNPAATNLHLIPYLQEAREKGATIIAVNPVRLPLEGLIDEQAAIRPGADVLLALAMAYVILEERCWQGDFVSAHVNGFASYAEAVAHFSPEQTAEEIGVDAATIRRLANLYAKGRPAAIVLGAGLLRYRDGYLAVRAIDALAAITGQLGIAGGGIHLASEGHEIGRAITSEDEGAALTIAANELAEAILRRKAAPTTAEPAIEVAVIHGANPISQAPNMQRSIEAFQAIPFKVAIDFYLTDTSRLADILLPAATSFEESDLFLSPYNDYIHYQPAIAPPRGQVWPEYRIWAELARRMGVDGGDEGAFWAAGPEVWLEGLLAPYGVSLSDWAGGGPRPNPGLQVIPFREGRFATPSAKVELAGEGKFKPLLERRKVIPVHPGLEPQGDDRFRLIFAHRPGRHNSQLWEMEGDDAGLADLALHPDDLRGLNLRPGDDVIVETAWGSLPLSVRADEGMPSRCALLSGGKPLLDGGGVNLLTGAAIVNRAAGDTDSQVIAINETFCRLRKIALAEHIG